MEELLSLKWNNHRSTFLHILGVLRDKQAYTDVTLACDGKFYSVHKLVLSTCSDYFCAMFDKTACKSPVIVLKDIKSEDLEALLDYMYLGEVNVRQSDLASLIKAAENLRIKGLAVPDDEPPKKSASSVPRNEVGRRDVGGSPPPKRKRRDEGEDGREDVRPHPLPSTLHNPPSSRPKSPTGASQRLSPSPHRTCQEPHPGDDRDSRPLSSPATSPATQPHHQGVPQGGSQPLGEQQQQQQQQQDVGGQQFRGEDTPTFVKVEMEEESGDMHRDTYDISGDGYKEENSGGDLGGDLSNDLPEFLQQAASGTLAGTSSSYPHAFAGPSGFQPDVSGWQGDSQSLPGNFSGLGFQPSQDNPGTREASATHPRQDSWHHVGSTPFLLPSPSSLNLLKANNGLPQAGPRPPHVRHRRAQSSEAEPSPALSCSVCGKVFAGAKRRYHLERHLITHTGERPFPCPHCPYRANVRENLVRHLRHRHPEYFTEEPRP